MGPINISGMQTSEGKSYFKMKNNLEKKPSRYDLSINNFGL